MKRNYSSLIFQIAVVLSVAGPATASTLTVTNANDKGTGSLRATINNAKNGDVIVFARSLNGKTIALTSDQLTINNSIDIEGPGASLLSVTGGDVNRVFNINEGLSVTIAGLTITHGRAVGGNGNPVGSGGGGAILNAGSTLTLTSDVFSENVSLGNGSDGPKGGAVAVFGSGFLTVTDSVFTNNRADGRIKKGIWAEGGAIYSDHDGPSARITRSTFTGNQAIGGDGNVNGFVGAASGGALHVEGTSTFTVIDSTFIGNEAVGGNGGTGFKALNFIAVDVAWGGAIASDGGSTLVISGSTFAYNQAVGGSNGIVGASPYGWVGTGLGGGVRSNGPATITNCTFTGNQAVGGSGNTAGTGFVYVGVGYGGALDNESLGVPTPLTVSNCTFTNNQASGGLGNTGGVYTGDGIGGGLSNFGATTTITASTFTNNQAIGGQGAAGGNGGDGLGGGVASVQGSILTAKTSVVSGNQAIGGTAGAGGSAGNGFGGGFYLTSDGSACWDPFTSANTSGNFASTSFNDVFGVFTICP